MQGQTDLSKYNNSWYKPGSALVRLLWYVCNALFFLNPFFPFSYPKVFLLRLFGARIGRGVVIKPRVNIKYPWKLIVGDYSWIGEQVWIDNLDEVKVGNNVCISQGAMLLCGNHHYKKSAFDLIVQPIQLEDGVWIGARAVVTPGVNCESHSILTVNSVANGTLTAYGIYQGNPAIKIRDRVIKS
jgi:putative colanic acid biosynthesis acetyltransferase WcaF